MVHRVRMISGIVSLAVLLAGMLVSSEWSHAPAQGKDERLNYDKGKLVNRLKDLRYVLKGEEEFTEEHKELFDLLAQHHAYRFTHKELQTKPGYMEALVKEAERELDTRKNGRNDKAVDLYQSRSVARLREVLPNRLPIASMNAARVLGKLGSMGVEEAMDPLAETIKTAPNDATRFWAFQGLRRFLELADKEPPDGPVTFRDKEREARCILALLEFLEKKPAFTSLTPHEEVEGYRLLRREAIRALALSRYPGVAGPKGAIQGRTAQVLLRILRNDGFEPDPRLDEQAEAAIGLARLKLQPSKDFKLANEYQPDVAAYHLGMFLIDLARTSQASASGTEAKLPWKVTAARLDEALEAMQKDTAKNKQAGPYVAEVLKRTRPVVQGLVKGSLPRLDTLADFLAQNPRDAAPVYSGLADSVIKPGVKKPVEEPKEKPEVPKKP